MSDYKFDFENGSLCFCMYSSWSSLVSSSPSLKLRMFRLNEFFKVSGSLLIFSRLNPIDSSFHCNIVMLPIPLCSVFHFKILPPTGQLNVNLLTKPPINFLCSCRVESSHDTSSASAGP